VNLIQNGTAYNPIDDLLTAGSSSSTSSIQGDKFIKFVLSPSDITNTNTHLPETISLEAATCDPADCVTAPGSSTTITYSSAETYSSKSVSAGDNLVVAADSELTIDADTVKLGTLTIQAGGKVKFADTTDGIHLQASSIVNEGEFEIGTEASPY